MRAKQVSLSVAAGLVTPGAVFLLNSGFGGFRFGFIEPWVAAMYVAVGVLLALAVALCRPILPVVYGITTALVCPLIGIVAGAGSNLVGLIVIALFMTGLVIAIPVTALATLLRRRRLPKWAPIAVGSVALLLSFGTQAWSSVRAHDASTKRNSCTPRPGLTTPLPLTDPIYRAYRRSHGVLTRLLARQKKTRHSSTAIGFISGARHSLILGSLPSPPFQCLAAIE